MDQAVDSYANLTAELYGPQGSVTLDALSALDLFLRDQNQILTDEEHKRILRDMEPWLEYYFFLSPVKEEIHRNPHLIVNFRDRIR
jgi:hypothetical protein